MNGKASRDLRRDLAGQDSKLLVDRVADAEKGLGI